MYRIGVSSIGRIGWHGVWRLRSLSELSARGRTVKNTVLGAYGCGLAGTFMSFIVLGNYGLSQQIKGTLDVVGELENGADIPSVILEVLNTLPGAKFVLIILVITMIAFYSTTFDALTMVVSSYSYKFLKGDENRIRRSEHSGR